MILQDLLGYLAATLTTTAFVPQALLTLRTRDVRGISLGMYGAFTLGVALWLAYGLALGEWPIVAANAVTLALSATILAVKVLEDRKRRQAEFLAAITAAVQKRAARDATRARLVTLITDWETGRSPAYRTFADSYMAQSHELAARIANLATPEQRQTAQRRVQRWVDDVAALGARKEP